MRLEGSLTWAQVLRWRLRRLCVEPPCTGLDAAGVADRLCGIQAQVPAAAELSVAVRTAGEGATLSAALAEGRLVRTWSVRGTLHALPVAMAARQLSLLNVARSWEKGSWQRAFASVAEIEALGERVEQALQGGPLTREELVTAVAGRVEGKDLSERLRSGWSALLKPLAWQGVLCQGPPRGRNVTLARPDRLLVDWPGLPNSDDAGPEVVRDYLRAFGPATMAAFDGWLLRGATPKRQLRRWFRALSEETATVDVEGRAAIALREDLDELAMTTPLFGEVHLLPGFDQYLLGPGTADEAILPREHRALVSRPGGWISPIVLCDGRIAGTWEAIDKRPQVHPFPGVELPRDALAAAADRVSGLLS